MTRLEYGLVFTTQELGLIQSIGYYLEQNSRLVQFLFAEVHSKSNGVERGVSYYNDEDSC